jgi:hypothetical protein
LADIDFYTLLARRIEGIEGADLSRQEIYAAARAALKKQAVLHRPYLGLDEIHGHMAALEDAIARLEAEFPAAEPSLPDAAGVASSGPGREEPAAPGTRMHDGIEESTSGFEVEIAPRPGGGPRVDDSPAFVSPSDQTDIWDDPGEPGPPRRQFERTHQELIVRPAPSWSHRDALAIYDVDLAAREASMRHAAPVPAPSPAKRFLAATALLVQLTIASLAGVTIYVFLMGQGGLPGLGRGDASPPAAGPVPQAPVSAQEGLAPVSPAPRSEVGSSGPLPAGHIPLPTMFGVYAVRDGRLNELEPVATEPVDPRAKHLQQIVKPSRTVLPDGKVTFLVFRRELIVNAPERIPVKFAARISRLMSFDPQGKVVWTQPAKDAWLIRDAGFDFRVMPVKESPEMVYVRPEDPDFTLPAGRYVLMVGHQPYDFVVEGPVTDPGHCVEGSATMRGSVFYECKPS